MSAATKPIPQDNAALVQRAREILVEGRPVVGRNVVQAVLDRLDDVVAENAKLEQLIEQLYLDAQVVSGSSAILFNRIIAARADAPRPHIGG